MRSFADSKATEAMEYPSSDGKPMAETEVHMVNMIDLISSLKQYYRNANDVYVAGNMLMFYVQGDKHKHVSPDVFVVRGLDKNIRDNYLVWAEGKAPDLVVELTSASTRKEDQEKKFQLYRDILKVREYFLFDPKEEYLSPSFQGYCLKRGRYVKIRAVKGRLPSEVLGLHLERDGSLLRLFDPVKAEWLLTPEETALAREKAELAQQQAEGAQQRAELAQQQAELAQKRAELVLQQAETARESAEAELQNQLLALQQTELELEKLRQALHKKQKN